MKLAAGFRAPSIAPRQFSRGVLWQTWRWFLLGLGLFSAFAMAQNAVVLVGSGSSVPAPLYNRWAQEFNQRNASIQMRYVPSGTREGIQLCLHRVSLQGEFQVPRSGGNHSFPQVASRRGHGTQLGHGRQGEKQP